MEKEIENYMSLREKIIDLQTKMETAESLIGGEIAEIKEKYGGFGTKSRKQKEKHILKKRAFLKAKEEEYNKRINDIAAPVIQLDKIFHLLKHNEKIRDMKYRFEGVPDSHSKDELIADLGDFYKDDLMHLKAFIFRNDKPKNKCSLMIAGLCGFGKEEGLFVPYSYEATPGFKQKPDVRAVLKDLPTVAELTKYYNKRKDVIFSKFIRNYETTKDEFYEALRFRLNYFKPLESIREISADEAPLVCKVEKREYRIYRGRYFEEAKKDEVIIEPFAYIKVAGKLYKDYCPQALMSICRSGAVIHEGWIAMDIEKIHSAKKSDYFNKDNYERILKEGKLYAKEISEGQERVSFGYQKVEWFNADIIAKRPEVD